MKNKNPKTKSPNRQYYCSLKLIRFSAHNQAGQFFSGLAAKQLSQCGLVPAENRSNSDLAVYLNQALKITAELRVWLSLASNPSRPPTQIITATIIRVQKLSQLISSQLSVAPNRKIISVQTAKKIINNIIYNLLNGRSRSGARNAIK